MQKQQSKKNSVTSEIFSLWREEIVASILGCMFPFKIIANCLYFAKLDRLQTLYQWVLFPLTLKEIHQGWKEMLSSRNSMPDLWAQDKVIHLIPGILQAEWFHICLRNTQPKHQLCFHEYCQICILKTDMLKEKVILKFLYTFGHGKKNCTIVRHQRCKLL